MSVSGALTASGVLTAGSGINADRLDHRRHPVTGNVISGASDVNPGRFHTNANCASGTSADGVWINDLTTAARRWKLYMKRQRRLQLYARYDCAAPSTRSSAHEKGPRPWQTQTPSSATLGSRSPS